MTDQQPAPPPEETLHVAITKHIVASPNGNALVDMGKLEKAIMDWFSVHTEQIFKERNDLKEALYNLHDKVEMIDDCTDNDGEPYQSADLNQAINDAERLLKIEYYDLPI